MLCSEIQIVKPGDGYEDIKPLPCNRWSCDLCGPRRRSRLIAQCASGEPNKILTLTVNPERGASPLHRRSLLHDAWKRLVKRILRHEGWKSIAYMAFVEKTKAGEPHLHILLRCGWISQKWLSAQMAQMIGAPIVWIETIKNTKHAIKYVSKYVTKEPAQFGSLKRYWKSRDWELSEPPENATSVFDRLTMSIQRERWSETISKPHREFQLVKEIGDGWYRFTQDWRHVAPSALYVGPYGRSLLRTP